MNKAFSRREFLQASSATAMASAITMSAWPATSAEAASHAPFRGTLCLFSKPAPQLSWSKLAQQAKQAGFDGIDLTVRPEGHVLPERAATDLPKAVAAIRAEGLEVPMISTALVSATDPTAEPILETASKLKILYVKPGYYFYKLANVVEERNRAGDRFRGLVELAEKYQIQIGYHNHTNYIGAALWDIAPVMDSVDSRWCGYYFDLGHASVDLGEDGWKVASNLVFPRLKMVGAKDFTWKPRGPHRWHAEPCPMGQGITPWREFLGLLAQSNFHGPISLQQEFTIPGVTDNQGIALSRHCSASDGFRENESGLSEIGAARGLPTDIEVVTREIIVAPHSHMTRRKFLKAVPAGALSLSSLRVAPLFAVSRRKPSDIRVKEIRISYENFPYRTPYQFGGRSVNQATLLNVDCTVETISGHVARGFGSMPMGNEWSFPSRILSYDTTLDAMKQLAERIHKITEGYTEAGHPIDINYALEPEYLKAATEVTKAMHLDQPIPKLCTIVTASPFDAAIHDAFGKAQGLNCYRTYGPEFMSNDLGHYLTPEFKGKYPSHYLLRAPQPWLWCNHSVGAQDPIDASEVKKQLHDGLPQTLAGWITADGLTHLKIKLNGNNLDADTTRVLHIDRVASEVENQRGTRHWYYSLDFNEQCPNVEYILDFIRRIKKGSPGCYDRITFIEQPTRRDLVATPEQYLFPVSKLKPVVMDESLTGFDALLRGRQIGYTGVALKACKGQSQSMVLNAAAQEFKMYMTAQDLTCPGASLIQSAGIAAHVAKIDTLESNGREYVPSANQPWLKRFPGLFQVRDGRLHTADLTGPGLSAV